MNTKRILEIGGLVAGVILIAFGVGAIYMGIDGRGTVRDSIEQEQIFFGNAETDEAVAKHAEQWSEEQVLTGDQARAFALVMRDHALEGAGGLTYSQLGRWVSAEDPSDPKGTNDLAAANMDEQGNPESNPTRDTWVTQTALSSALNMSYMAEQIALFGMVVGVALLLAGIGFIILALVVLGAGAEARAAEGARTTAPAAG